MSSEINKKVEQIPTFLVNSIYFDYDFLNSFTRQQKFCSVVENGYTNGLFCKIVNKRKFFNSCYEVVVFWEYRDLLALKMRDTKKGKRNVGICSTF
jgi:hypothetical protein